MLPILTPLRPHTPPPQIRLMLVLAPAVCCLAAVALSDLLYVLCASLR